MELGFIMLCHTALNRAAQVARHWAERGCPVVIHLDLRVKPAAAAKLRADLADLKDLRILQTRACEWGTWGLVAATLDASEEMLRSFPQVGHIYLASGSCLPLRPASELRDYLAERPGTDFIESVTTTEVGWTVGGLDAERFTLRFPFGWRRNRWLFDAYVKFQRRLGVKRKIPSPLVPHLGSQWWCLTRNTLEAILKDPRRPLFERYFKRVWIPDESYFQTLVRLHSGAIESRSLTLSKFDHQGKPHVFYDDHMQLLRRSDCFVARKIWPQANRLYRNFLTQSETDTPRAGPSPGKIDRLFAKATERRTRGRAGLYMQSRFPREGWENGLSSAPYAVFEGFSDLFEGFDTWLSRSLGGRVHGHLFAPDRVHYAGGATIYNGCLSDSAALRDYDPRLFLTSLIWNTRGERQCFQFGPADNQAISWFMAKDQNAQISVITGAWALKVFHSQGDFAQKRREAARLQRIEAEHLEILRSHHSRARVRIWTLAEALEDPAEILAEALGEIAPLPQRGFAELPPIVEMAGFGRFIQDLRNQGMKPVLMGDIPLADQPQSPRGRRARSQVDS